jgi:amino acid adenylation domain-containing protein
MDVASTVDAGYPLSTQQALALRLWKATGRMPCSVVTIDAIDTPGDRLRHAITRLGERHEILRTLYQEVVGLELPLQVIRPESQSVIRELESGRDAQSQALQSHSSVDPATGPVLSVWVAPKPARTVTLIVPWCVADIVGVVQLASELKALCQGDAMDEEGLQYADYSDWQIELQDTAFGREAAEFWRRALDPSLLAMHLPFERPVQRDSEVVRTPVGDGTLIESLRALEGAMSASTQETIFALWTAFAATLLETDQIVCAMTADCRSTELQGVLGSFTARLPLHIPVSKEGLLIEHLPTLRQVMEQGLAYKHCSPAENVTLPFGFSYVEMPAAASGIHVTVDAVAPEKLLLECVVERGKVELSLLSSKQRFAPQALAAWARQFSTFIVSAARSPATAIGKHRALSDDERMMLLETFSGTTTGVRSDPTLLHELFEQQAVRTPNAIAVFQDGEQISYTQLRERSNQLAHRLIAQGASADHIVGVYAERSIAMVVAVLGILKAGAAYLPLDRDYPTERLAWMAADARVRIVVVDASSRGELALPADIQVVSLHPQSEVWRQPVTAPQIDCDPSTLAYVIYTSGSSGRPKGVMIDHGNAVASTRARHDFYSQPVSAFLLLSSFSFDSSVAGLFWTLSQGGRLCLPSTSQQKDANALATLIQSQRVSHLLALPSFYARILDSLEYSALRCVIVAGEACAEDLPQLHYQRAPQAELVNEYGPTEATVWATAERLSIDEPRRPIPIGRPTSATRVYVVDANLEPVAIGRTGEIVIGGLGVARGYLQRPSLTAERFVADPFSKVPGARLYRTSDLSRLSAQGTLQFMGRLDSQVKLRGFRIELGEIEARLREHESVRHAAVVVREATESTKQLVAYIVPRDVASRNSEQLATHLRTRLPPYMMPNHYVWLESLPRTPNGKIDHKGLPPPVNLADAQPYVEPRNDIERTLADLWQSVLKVPRVSVNDNFFTLGGDSILTLLLIAQAKQRNLVLTPQQIFEHPTIAECARLAQPLVAAPEQPDAPTKPAYLSLSDRDLDGLGLAASDIEDVYPMTPMQHGILLHSLMGVGTGIYHMQDIYRINTPIDPGALLQAWSHIVRCHSALRTGFLLSDAHGALQVVYRDVQPAFEYLDWRSLPPTEQSQALDELLRTERKTGFDLSRPPLMRARLIQMTATTSCFVRSNHHILMDAWCHTLLLRDLLLSYRAYLAGETPQLPPVPAYRAYIDWLGQQDREEARAFWKQELSGMEQATPVGEAAIPDHAGATNDVVNELEVRLTDSETTRVVDVAKSLGITPNTILQAAWALTLAAHAGLDDVVFGVTTSGRPSDLENAESIVGLFIQSIPLRVRIDRTERVATFLHRLFQKNASIRLREHLSLVDIRRCCDLREGPLFHSLFVFENAPTEAVVHQYGQAFEVETVSARVHTNYPVTIMVVPGQEYRLHISYNSALLSASGAELLLTHLKRGLLNLLEEANQRVGAISLLDSQERHRLLFEVNQTTRAYPFEAGYVELFERQVALHPQRSAASCQSDSWTYARLNARANHIAHELMSAGIAPDDRVAVWLPRGLEFLASVLGILKAGAGYVPLDPSHPDQRVSTILRSSRARAVVACEAFAGRLAVMLSEYGSETRPAMLLLEAIPQEDTPRLDPNIPTHPHQAAYVIYTSGSTGTPKGALIDRRGMLNNQLSKVPLLQLTQDDVIAQTASQCFDISVWQFLAPLLVGARVDIVPDLIAQDPESLLHHVAEAGITVVESVPSLIQGLLMAEHSNLAKLRWMIATGEALPASLARQWLARYPRVPLVNAYGPAECSDDVAMHVQQAPLPEAATMVPLGSPTDNNRLYVLDPMLELAPIGAIGELYVAGVGVGRGYVGDVAGTVTRFVPNPYAQEAGERLYRTGDLARYRSDGALEFLGRCDHQVKVRGLRIELGEIETRLVEHADVLEAAVLAPELRRDERSLVAYVVLRSEAGDSDLQDHLRRTLPGYMVPKHFVRLPALPRNRNGKVDRGALPAVDCASRPTVHVPARDAAEARLVSIWKELLTLEQVSIDDDFFALGGHSLLATQVMSRVRRELGVTLPLRSVFELPTIAKLATLIRSKQVTEPESERSQRLAALMTELEASP